MAALRARPWPALRASAWPAGAGSQVRAIIHQRTRPRDQAGHSERKRQVAEDQRSSTRADRTTERRPIRAGSAGAPRRGRRRFPARPERQERFLTTSGVEIQDLYTPADVAGLDESRDLGRPGEYPYTRGVQPTMYRGRLWTMRQYAGFSTAEDTNRRFRYLLEQGQTGLSVAFDLPTQMGYDSDAPQAEGEVGRVGVPISSLADMEVLLDGLPLGDRQHVDDDQRLRRRPAGPVRGRGREAGRGPGPGQRHDPERHPQGVHRPRHLHLPAAAVDAARHRHLRVLLDGAAALEHHQHQRLPHARGRRHGGPGAGLHPGRRHRLRRGGR